MTESCPVCEDELVTVTLVTEEGKVRIGRKCARLLEALARLAGVRNLRRQPYLREVP